MRGNGIIVDNSAINAGSGGSIVLTTNNVLSITGTTTLQSAGGTLDNVVKLTLFLTDLGKFAAANAIMAELIPQPFPARSTIGVASLPKDAQFEVEAILVI